MAATLRAEQPREKEIFFGKAILIVVGGYLTSCSTATLRENNLRRHFFCLPRIGNSVGVSL